MQLNQPETVLYGPGCIQELPAYLPDGAIALISGRTFARQAGILEVINSRLEKAGHAVIIIDAVPPEPRVADVQRVLDIAVKENISACIGLGGGSVIDVAKAAAGLYHCSGTVADYFNGREIEKEGIAFIAIPSTAGTGSEATPNSVLIDHDAEIKKSIRTPDMLPDIAVLDPEITISCPSRITAHSGMDALVQGIEALFSRNGNAMTEALAIMGISMILDGLETAFTDGHDIEARSSLLYGSYQIGVAFANARLGAVHGMAHPIGLFTDTPHGLVCARLMQPVLKINSRACPAHYARLGRIMLNDPLQRLEELLNNLGIDPLFNAELTDRQFEQLLQYTAKAGSMAANPVELDSDQQKAVLAEAGILIVNG